MPREIDGQSFDHEVLNSETPVIVDFYSPTCMPCKNVERTLQEVEENHGDKVKVLKVNVFESPQKACQFSIMTVPTVIGFSKGRITNSLSGERKISEYLELVK